MSFFNCLIPLVFLFVLQKTAAQAVPEVFEANPKAGGGGENFKESNRFRVYNAPDDAKADAALKLLESAYTCFVEDLGWRSSGLSYNAPNDKGPFLKMNAYAVSSPRDIGGAGGVMGSDARTGHSFIKVVGSSIGQAGVTVHEYGHALTYYEKTWVDQGQTGTWWETVAQFVADTYMTSPLCEAARKKYGQPEGKTIINLSKVLGTAHQVFVDGTSSSGNHYDAWPFLTYLTNNPDNIQGLGKTGVRDLFRKYAKRTNETPLHALEHVVSPGSSAQKVVALYWARMAFVAIGHKQAERQFATLRARINYANLDTTGSGIYEVKESRQPKYMGANIIPLKNIAGGQIDVKITAEGAFTAMMAVRPKSGVARYFEIPQGSGQVKVEAGEEASLVIVNTPAQLIMYDGFKVAGSEVANGLSYQLQLTGATA